MSFVSYIDDEKLMDAASKALSKGILKKESAQKELKNKYNTVSGGDLSSKYETLENLVMPKNSEYKDYISYFVHIIPKKPHRYDECF